MNSAESGSAVAPGLCAQCTTIYFAELLRSERPMQRALPLGRLEDILARRTSCSFCDLVAESLAFPQPFSSDTASAQKVLRSLQDDGGGTDCWLYSYCVVKAYPSAVLRLAITTQHPDATGSIRFARRPHAGDIQMLATSLSPLGKRPERPDCYGENVNTAKADLGQCKAWVSDCRSLHKNACNHPGFQGTARSPLPSPLDLEVINVHSRSLDTLLSEEEYVTLSYCWPSHPGLVNRAEHRARLYDNGYISASNGLSKTIDDAIECTAALGYHYLWVDAICIRQDDADDKMHQIAQMDRVYGSAVFTIVCASAGDAWDGLPGFRKMASARRQVCRSVKGLDLAVTKPCLEDVVALTRWDTRGWTFQENFLSRRLLMFTEYQTYFQCSSGIRCEDSAGGPHDPGLCIAPSTNLWNPRYLHAKRGDDTDYGKLLLPYSKYLNSADEVRAYDNFVSSYLRRNLTFSGDVLVAFTGLLRVFEHTMGTKFIYGLPRKWLHHALLWQPTDAPRRRKEFPSWSWAGWESGSEPPYWLTPRQSVPLTQWVLTGTGTDDATSHYAAEEYAHGSLDVIVDREALGLSGRHISEGYWQDYMSHTTSIGPRLGCITGIARLQVDGTVHETEIDDLFPWGAHMRILDRDGRLAGLILLEKQWTEHNILVKGCSRFYFILLSKADRARVEGVPIFDGDVYEKRPWCLLDVMLVVYVKDGMERVAVGVVHEDAWKAANPALRTVMLA